MKRAKPDAKSDHFGGRERRGKVAGVAHPPGQVEALKLIETVSASALP